MKKKLLAVVLSVVMIAALLVPMMAISAEGNPTAKISLGTPFITERDYDEDGVSEANVLGVPVYFSENTGAAFAFRYQVLSNDGLTPYYKVFNEGMGDEEYADAGWDTGNFEKKVGKNVISLNYTGGQDPADTDKTGFQVVQDSTSGTTGINLEEGQLGTVYFVAPTTPGTYTFEVKWMDGCVPDLTKYVVTNGASVSYTVECTEHKWGEGVAAEGVACGSTADVVYTCENGCGKTKTETGAKVEHNWVEDADAYVAPKCGVAGKKVFECTNANCPEGTKEEAVAALEHEWDNGTADPSKVCGETADVVYTCENGCGETKTETGAKVEHNWVEDADAYVAPKCGVAGKKVFECTNANCPEGTKEEAVAALEHVWGEYTVTQAPTADAEGAMEADCTLGCGKKDIIDLKKLATFVEQKDEDGKVLITFKSDEAILPEDILPVVIDSDEDAETGRITEVITFGSSLVNLAGEVELAINLGAGYANFEVVTTDAEGNEVVVESTFVDGVLTFNADLTGEYAISYDEVKTSPDTSDAANTVVFAVVALMAVAGLVVVGKKRFAL